VRLLDGSGVSREVHAPFCERLRVKLSWPTHLSYCPSEVRGQHGYLYLIMDIYSRKIVAWEVHLAESGDEAATLLAKMYDLGITPSRGRSWVSNDNAFSESLFRTLKYCPQWPQGGFASLDDARSWVRDFMRWYNTEHRHSRIRFVTPAERHRGLDAGILGRRHSLYQRARSAHPERWSGHTRNWEAIEQVTLNPETLESPQEGRERKAA